MRGRRHKHNLSHYQLTTGRLGDILPIGLVEVLPGDTFQHSTSVLVRLSPLSAPVMHSMSVRIHHFFVPHRLAWPKDYPSAGSPVSFEEFITGGPDGNDATEMPSLINSGTPSNLFDLYGVPPVAGAKLCSLPIRGYNMIFNEYYRDQDLVAERPLSQQEFASGARVHCAWEKDYFSSARPWPQKGEEVTVPLGTSAPVRGIGKQDGNFSNINESVIEYGGAAAVYPHAANIGFTDASLEARFFAQGTAATGGSPNIYADLSQAAAAKVNDIRRAFALQRFQEARARYGSRYTEYLRYLGITPSDARLDRPEYLGGGRVRVAVSEVLQTAPEGSPPVRDPAYGVGDLYGHGIAAIRSNAYRRFFEEHGYVHTFLSVRPRVIYQTATDRHWFRRYREDMFQKELQFIGQQEIFNKEIFAQTDAPAGDEVWGYQDRYRELREQASHVTGEFRDKLSYWHLARQFTEQPALNETFVKCQPTRRIFNEQSQDSLWIMSQHSLVARRIVSRTAAPKIL